MTKKYEWYEDRLQHPNTYPFLHLSVALETNYFFPLSSSWDFVEPLQTSPSALPPSHSFSVAVRSSVNLCTI